MNALNRGRSVIFATVIALVMRKPGEITFSDAMYVGAEKVGISPNTAYRYLRKMISEAGPLELIGPKGNQRLIIRESHWGNQQPTIQSPDPAKQKEGAS